MSIRSHWSRQEMAHVLHIIAFGGNKVTIDLIQTILEEKGYERTVDGVNTFVSRAIQAINATAFHSDYTRPGLLKFTNMVRVLASGYGIKLTINSAIDGIILRSIAEIKPLPPGTKRGPADTNRQHARQNTTTGDNIVSVEMAPIPQIAQHVNDIQFIKRCHFDSITWTNMINDWRTNHDKSGPIAAKTARRYLGGGVSYKNGPPGWFKTALRDIVSIMRHVGK